jgi:hypothetical protein
VYTCVHRSNSARSVSGFIEKKKERERKRENEGIHGELKAERERKMSENLLFVRAGNR